MDFKQIKELIDTLAQIGTQRISFTGGEPLMRADIGEILAVCKKNRIFTTLGSNGKLVPH